MRSLKEFLKNYQKVIKETLKLTKSNERLAYFFERGSYDFVTDGKIAVVFKTDRKDESHQKAYKLEGNILIENDEVTPPDIGSIIEHHLDKDNKIIEDVVDLPRDNRTLLNLFYEINKKYGAKIDVLTYHKIMLPWFDENYSVKYVLDAEDTKTRVVLFESKDSYLLIMPFTIDG